MSVQNVSSTSRKSLHQPRPRSAKCTVVAALLLFGGVTGNSPAQKPKDDMQAAFFEPPQTARPQVWWHWMSGNVSEEGAALDLAWMRRIGIGGVHIFSGSLMEPTVVSPPVPFMSPMWKQTFGSMVTKARQYGMDVTIAGSPGWSETGGIWVAPEDAMKKYVWSETTVEGGVPIRGSLTQPPSITGPYQAVRRKVSNHVAVELTHDVYRDAAVVAFPTPKALHASASPEVTSNSQQFDPALTRSHGTSSPLLLAPGTDDASVYVQFAYPTDVTLHALTIGLSVPADVEIQAADDNRQFHTVLQVPADRTEQPSPQATLSFPALRAKLMRAVLTPVAPIALPGMPKGMTPGRAKTISLTYISFNTVDRINHFEAKAGFASTVDFSAVKTPDASRDGVVRSKDIVDLTSKIRADGSLDWTPPSGQWTILRFGYSLTGQTNAPAEVAATGLEVDKLDPALVRTYMEHYLDLYQDASGGRLGQAGVQNVLTDSWEAGVQNWTPTMLAQFKSRRGYDLTPYLPALAGWVVDDANTSDRFLWDFHHSLKEMLADDHYGTIATIMHEHGMGYYTEAEGDYPRAIGDGMTMKSRADIPTGEFWYRNFSTEPGQPPLRADLDESASVAHIYGKKYAASESLTVGAISDPWSFSPAMLKPIIDEIFAHGINRILLHESHHQPFVDKKPGLTLGIFGQYLNRNDTWAEQAKPWTDYLARTSFLLQQGRFVADVAFFYGEDRSLSEIYLHRFNADVPQGYAYDYVNPEALLTLLSVRNGRLVTPSGMSYRALYLPSYVDRLTLPALEKIRQLAAAGATIVGAKPKGGLGLADDDRKVQDIVEEVWGESAGSVVTAHRLGAGRVYGTTDLASALRDENIQPDIAVAAAHQDSSIMAVHRHTNERDIYFVSNQRDRGEPVSIRYRLAGMAPEVWHPEDGSVTPVSYNSDAHGVTVSLDMKPYEAVFVVFHRTSVRTLHVPPVHLRELQTLSGPWNITFEPGRGAPAAARFSTLQAWNESPDLGIRYFSGHATYTQTLTVPASALKHGSRLLLDLGEVHEVAEVSVNGSAPIIVWHGPYTADITNFLREGSNRVSITVTNLWPNRLIGDKQPGGATYTYAPQSSYRANSPLLPSGLLGPVRLVASSRSNTR